MDQNQFSKPLVAATTALSLVAGFAAGYFMPSLNTASATKVAAKEPAKAAPNAAERRFKIPVTDSQPTDGPATALVTIVQWCDLPDNGCSRMEPAIRSVLERDPGFVRLVFRHYPHSDDRMSLAAHQFARAAFEQGGSEKFWKVREKLLGMLARPTMDDLERIANGLGLDWKSFEPGIEKDAFGHVVGGDRVFATMFEVKASNAIFVNGRPIEGEPNANKLKALVEEELKAAVKLVAQGVPQEEVYAELTKSGVWNRPDLHAQ